MFELQSGHLYIIIYPLVHFCTLFLLNNLLPVSSLLCHLGREQPHALCESRRVLSSSSCSMLMERPSEAEDTLLSSGCHQSSDRRARYLTCVCFDFFICQLETTVNSLSL